MTSISPPRLSQKGKAGFAFCLLLLLIGCALWRIRSLPTPPSVPSPFPTVVNGEQVRWIPDKETRAVAAGLTPDDVVRIEFYGCGSSGVPQQVEITRKELIALFMKGLSKALKREDEPFLRHGIHTTKYGSTMTVNPSDKLFLVFLPPGGGPLQFRETIFLADVLEGERKFSPKGTISPEFQTALRTAGIPSKRPENLVQKLAIEYAVSIRGRK